MSINIGGIRPYEQGFITGFIDGFSTKLASFFEKEIREKLESKARDLIAEDSEFDVEKLMDEASDSFYYFWNVVPKEEIDEVLKSDKAEKKES